MSGVGGANRGLLKGGGAGAEAPGATGRGRGLQKGGLLGQGGGVGGESAPTPAPTTAPAIVLAPTVGGGGGGEGRGGGKGKGPAPAAEEGGDAMLVAVVLGCVLWFLLLSAAAYLLYKFSKGDEIRICCFVLCRKNPEKKLVSSGLLKGGAGAPTSPPKVPIAGPSAPERASHLKQRASQAEPLGKPELMHLPVCQDLEFASEGNLDPQFPEYWTSKMKRQTPPNKSSISTSSNTNVMRHQVTEANMASVQAMMDGTWADIITRDRKSEGGIKKFQVVQVLRIENVELWRKYSEYRDRIEQACSEDPKFEKHKVQTHQLGRDSEFENSKDVARLLEKMQPRKNANEFLLFHGTKPSAAAAICENGFHVDLAGSHVGAMYGPGVYLAERSSKADEYAADDQEGAYQGLFAMLLCRATCGVMNVCEDVKPDVSSLVQSVMDKGTHHSVLGDREKARGTYREFIVFDSCQTYPEFLVIYRRYVQTTE